MASNEIVLYNVKYIRYPDLVKRVILGLFSLITGAACLFFAWYTIRLAWINIAVAGAAQHRQTGMYIGAVAFPVATLLFGYLTWRCWVKLRGDRP